MGRRPEGATARLDRVMVRMTAAGRGLLQEYADAEHDGNVSRAVRELVGAGLRGWKARR